MTREEVLAKIEEDEEIYEKVLMFNAKTICDDINIKFVLVAGPSCAGKTTTARKLREYMIARGKIVYTISLDDFYLNSEDCPRMEDGKFDFETIYALDLDCIHKCLASLCEGKRTELPLFDFPSHSRKSEVVVIEPTDHDIYIVEGLHALNTLIYSSVVDEKHIFRIYLDSFEESGAKKGQTRFLRRLVRDYYYRSAKAERTFDMWENVASGEDKYIRPYAHLAEGCVNTFFDYETAVLKKSAVRILSEIPHNSQYKPQADKVMQSLYDDESLCPSVVPESSLLQEFIPPREFW
ncbi:MAG: nucleoside kinase [Clostridia bacterium]|nr:nucleoside kinase [Clostridia bacterium]